MSFGDPNNPYGQPQNPQQPPQQPGYGYPQAPQAPAGYGYPQQPGYGMQPPYANWGQRFLGLLVDILVFVPGYIIIAIGGATRIWALLIVGYLALIGLAIWQL